jgi:hypothetical protein
VKIIDGVSQDTPAQKTKKSQTGKRQSPGKNEYTEETEDSIN